jgi:hypothetical protein
MQSLRETKLADGKSFHGNTETGLGNEEELLAFDNESRVILRNELSNSSSHIITAAINLDIDIHCVSLMIKEIEGETADECMLYTMELEYA